MVFIILLMLIVGTISLLVQFSVNKNLVESIITMGHKVQFHPQHGYLIIKQCHDQEVFHKIEYTVINKVFCPSCGKVINK